jgi:hypothetical protein
MKTMLFIWISLTVMSLLALTSAATEPSGDLVETVRQATERFQNVEEATAAGYADTLLCVNGPEEGAMGVHFANADLIGDGTLDPERPELLVYEPKNGQLHLVAVEYLVLAEAWDANNPTTPSLLGQLFLYYGSPNRYGTQLTLGRLSPPQVETMVRQLTGDKPLPADVLAQVVARTDGVPLFVEEIVKMLLESGLVREDADRYGLTGPLPPLAIPATLQDSLMARLDRLSTARTVAQLGAVLGREFTYELIRAVAPLDEATVQRGLGQLVDAELLYQRGRPPQARYVFKHATIQEAAYQSLMRRGRSPGPWSESRAPCGRLMSRQVHSLWHRSYSCQGAGVPRCPAGRLRPLKLRSEKGYLWTSFRRHSDVDRLCPGFGPGPKLLPSARRPLRAVGPAEALRDRDR